MKKLVFLLALVATALFSCSKENDPSNEQPTGSKTVVVKFASAALSRATEPAVSQAAKVSDFTIFFLDKDNNVVLGTKSGTDASGAVACTAVAEAATTVYVVANANTILNLTDVTTLATLKTLADIQALTAAVTTQTDITNVVLNNAAGVNENGKITSAGNNPVTYSASVTIAPALARIEIAGVKCTTTASTAFTVEGIYLDRYATTFTAGGGYDNTATGDNITEGIFIIDKNTDRLPSASNSFADVADVAATSSVAAPTAGRWAYQLAAGAPLPKIIVKLKDINGVSGTRYITVSNYKNGGGTSYTELLQAGTVYQVSNIEFEANEELPDIPNATDKDVSVTVTIQNWNYVALTPGL